MKVSLINVTPDALALLLRTKNTRLKHDENPAFWPLEKQMEHLGYMRDTIKSSWEFVDYVFEIEGVTRAFTHQFVRTRTGAFAQESQRAVDVAENDILKPELKSRESNDFWDAAARFAKSAYTRMVADGTPLQDARGILPTNTTTSIIAKFDLRGLHEMAKVRLCTRTAGEYQDVFRAMRQSVIDFHPWAADFIQVACAAEGICAFPRYGSKECPVWFPALDRTRERQEAQQRWEAIRYVANPKAKDGKAVGNT